MIENPLIPPLVLACFVIALLICAFLYIFSKGPDGDDK